ncbi:hypothetical protein ACFPN7_15890 [Amycolatopsis halotolerans]|uniref:hypothetical protein n=1 Tax=Amycolatopsis halotolerans TaxID=330083 RepID=UPI00361A8B66
MNPGQQNGHPGCTPTDARQQPSSHHATAAPDTILDATDSAEQLRRRRAASQRLPPLADGRVDPWADVEPVGVSEQNLRAARRTWHHLRDLGLLTEHVEEFLQREITDARGGRVAA